jgi:anti-anti-sigma factor
VATVGEALVNSRRLVDGTVVVELRGEIDAATVEHLRRVLVDSVLRQRPVRVTVDLLHVTFIDSTGIGALAAGYNAARGVGIGFEVVNPAPFVVGQLRMLGLYDAFGLGRTRA